MFFKKDKNDELEFISVSSASLIETNPRKSKVILWIIIGFVFAAIIWASLAEVDEIVRGTGKIIPSSHVQIIQNLEGGVVSEVFVRPGDIVEAGQRLIKIDNKRFESSLGESRVSLNSLRARAVRLYAASRGMDFKSAEAELSFTDIPEEILYNEKNLFDKDMAALEGELSVIREQINQVNIRNQELRVRIASLEESLELT